VIPAAIQNDSMQTSIATFIFNFIFRKQFFDDWNGVTLILTAGTSSQLVVNFFMTDYVKRFILRHANNHAEGFRECRKFHCSNAFKSVLAHILRQSRCVFRKFG